MRKTYSGEYKRKAVALVLERKFTVKQVCKELELHENTLYRWIREIENHGQRAFPGKGSRDWISQNKLKQLEKENQKIFLTGLVIYGIDTVLFIFTKEWFSVAFHIFAFWMLFVGYRTLLTKKKNENKEE